LAILAEGRNEKTSGFYRALKEVPTLLMIGIA
jgi:uncharacterized membrane protein